MTPTTATESASLLVLLTSLILGIRSNKPRFTTHTVGVLCLVLFTMWSGPLFGQDTSDLRLNVQRFNLAPQVDGFARIQGAEQPDKAQFGLVGSVNYALNPFELGSAGNNRHIGVVDHLIGIDLATVVVANRWVQFGASMPVLQARINSPESQAKAAKLGAKRALGVGDLALSAGFQALRQEQYGVALALIPRFVFPTGSQRDFVGSGSFGVGGDLSLARDFRWVHATASLGAQYESAPSLLGNIYAGPEFRWGLGIGVPLGQTGWEVQAEYVGATGIAARSDARPDYRAFDPLHSPQEVTLGIAYRPNGKWSVGAAAGPGLGKGFGTPDARSFARAGWSSRKSDRDRDLIADRQDACPDQPEDLNGYQDHDGCPDGPLDSDADTIVDSQDACPLDPEDFDGHQDQDGCPDLDNDLDGIADLDDACPDQPEVINAVDDQDGCPDQALVVVELDEGRMARIAILRKVYFDVDKAVIRPESTPVLDAVVDVLAAYPEIRRIEVAGHTDSDGTDRHNQRLSQARVESVVAYLTAQGIASDRLHPRGYGEHRPITSNHTPEAKQRNRRVEFIILDLEDSNLSSSSTSPVLTEQDQVAATSGPRP